MPLTTWVAAGVLVVLGASAATGATIVIRTSGPLSAQVTPTSVAAQPTAEPQLDVVTLGHTGVSIIRPQAIARFGDDYFIADPYEHVVVKVSQAGTATVIAGTGEQGVTDGPALSATFAGPTGIAIAADGTIYLADDIGHRIRKIDQAGFVSTIAGSGVVGLGAGGYRDGPANQALFNLPVAIALDADGGLLVVDKDNNRIRKILDGTVSTIIGSGVSGLKDGPAAEAALSAPSAIVVGSNGTIFLAEHGNNAIRMVSHGQVTTLFAAIPSGPAQQPSTGRVGGLTFPTGLAVDRDGSLLVADTQANRIVRIQMNGSIGVVAGGSGGGRPGSVDGPARLASFTGPTSVVLGPKGEIAIGDLGTGSIRIAVR